MRLGSRPGELRPAARLGAQGFEAFADAGVRGWWDSGRPGHGPIWTERRPRAWYAELTGGDPGPCLRRVPGRETFLWEPAAGSVAARVSVAVVKRYVRATSELSERCHEWLRGRSARSPARREFENLLALAGLGLAVPRALALFEDESSGASLVVMQHVEHRRTLAQVLVDPRERQTPRRARLVEELCRETARLHDAGWYHRDFYLQHWLVARAARDPEPPDARELVLIDVGRARHEPHPRSRWFVKDLAALWHSRLEAAAAVGSAADLADLPDGAEGAGGAEGAEGERFLGPFLARYLAHRFGAEPRPAEVERWASRVERKAARIASHAPRHVDLRRAAHVGSGGTG